MSARTAASRPAPTRRGCFSTTAQRGAAAAGRLGRGQKRESRAVGFFSPCSFGSVVLLRASSAGPTPPPLASPPPHLLHGVAQLVLRVLHQRLHLPQHLAQAGGPPPPAGPRRGAARSCQRGRQQQQQQQRRSRPRSRSRCRSPCPPHAGGAAPAAPRAGCGLAARRWGGAGRQRAAPQCSASPAAPRSPSSARPAPPCPGPARPPRPRVDGDSCLTISPFRVLLSSLQRGSSIDVVGSGGPASSLRVGTSSLWLASTLLSLMTSFQIFFPKISDNVIIFLPVFIFPGFHVTLPVRAAPQESRRWF